MNERKRGAPPKSGQARRNTAPKKSTGAKRKQPAGAAVEARRRKKQERQQIRVRNSNFWLRLLTVAGIVLAIVIGFTVFFRVEKLEVAYLKKDSGPQLETQAEGETGPALEQSAVPYYSEEEILAASGIELGDNLLTLSKDATAAAIMAKFPYISEVQIDRTLPNKVTLTVREYETTYAVRDTDGGWSLINCNGTILEKTDAATASTHIVVDGLYIAPGEVGTQISAAMRAGIALPGAEEDAASAGAELEARQRSLLQVLKLLENYDYARQIVSIDISNSYSIVLWYGTQYKIILGNTEHLEYKMAYLDRVLAQLEAYRSGTLDFSSAYEDKTVRYQPFD